MNDHLPVKAKVGRPAWTPTADTFEEIERLAAQGLTMAQIADALGIADSTLYDHKRKKSELLDSIKRGQARGIQKVANSLYEAACEGNIAAMIFYLKCRGGWKETDVHELTGPEGKAIVFRYDVIEK